MAQVQSISSLTWTAGFGST